MYDSLRDDVEEDTPVNTLGLFALLLCWCCLPICHCMLCVGVAIMKQKVKSKGRFGQRPRLEDAGKATSVHRFYPSLRKPRLQKQSNSLRWL